MYKYDVVVAGTVCCDIIFYGLPAFPKIGEEIWTEGVEVTPGGAMNTAAALARLGLDVALSSPIGNDFWGNYLLTKIKEENISIEYTYFLNQPSPQLSVALNYDQDRAFVSYSDPSIQEFYTHILKETLLKCDANFIHLYASPIPGYTEMLKELKMAGKNISLDTGWNPEFLKSDEIKQQIYYSDYFMPNLMEAQYITGQQDPYQALQNLGELTSNVVIKLDSKGAISLINKKMYSSIITPVIPIDTTGAGDCFNAGFLYGVLKGFDPHTCLKIGNFCGKRSVLTVGGYNGAPTEKLVLDSISI
jgi:sugar/nucleoside kinase (ribokinase family)